MTIIYFCFWLLLFSEYFFTSVRDTLELLAINEEKPLSSLKNNFFVWWGAIIDKTFDSINQ